MLAHSGHGEGFRVHLVGPAVDRVGDADATPLPRPSSALRDTVRAVVDQSESLSAEAGRRGVGAVASMRTVQVPVTLVLPAASRDRMSKECGPWPLPAATMKASPAAVVHSDVPAGRYCVAATVLPPLSVALRCTVTSVLCHAPSASSRSSAA